MLDNNGNNFSDDFYNQPIIKLLASGWLKLYNKPSAIQPTNFSRELVQTIKRKVQNQKGDNFQRKQKNQEIQIEKLNFLGLLHFT